MSLKHFLSPTREALRNAVRPLACGEPIGLMLSGGTGSAALLAVMKEVGVNVIAYHLDAAEPAASELRFAQMTCEALDVPLKTIMMDTSCHYLSPSWVFPHPDGHPWPRRFSQVAQQARQDDICLLVTGAGDDHAFGPADYGVWSLLLANIEWQEKLHMIQGFLATDWNILDIIKSLWPSYMLYGPKAPTKANREMRKADFLTPLSLPPRGLDDAAVLHSLCFAPQAIAVEQAIL